MPKVQDKQHIAKQPVADQLHDAETSLLRRYCLKAVGDVRLSRLMKYELASLLFGNLYGGLGYVMRKWFWAGLFKSAGSGLILGRGVSLRHPGKVALGNRVAIDDHVLIDAGGADIVIGDDVIISRNCVIQSKTGPVCIGSRTDIGCNTLLSSVTGIFIEDVVLIAGNCYIGGARYHADDANMPIMDQGIYSKGPVYIGKGTWLGAGVTVLDGIRIGKGCIIGAGAVVTRDIPDFSVTIGTPASVVGKKDA
jgi:acetyltransferase-like isoleucine patch superfamily enzyme